VLDHVVDRCGADQIHVVKNLAEVVEVAVSIHQTGRHRAAAGIDHAGILSDVCVGALVIPDIDNLLAPGGERGGRGSLAGKRDDARVHEDEICGLGCPRSARPHQ